MIQGRGRRRGVRTPSLFTHSSSHFRISGPKLLLNTRDPTVAPCSRKSLGDKPRSLKHFVSFDIFTPNLLRRPLGPLDLPSHFAKDSNSHRITEITLMICISFVHCSRFSKEAAARNLLKMLSYTESIDTCVCMAYLLFSRNIF